MNAEQQPEITIPEGFKDFAEFFMMLPHTLDRSNFLFSPTTPRTLNIWVKSLSKDEIIQIVLRAQKQGLIIQMDATIDNNLPAIKITPTLDPNPQLSF